MPYSQHPNTNCMTWVVQYHPVYIYKLNTVIMGGTLMSTQVFVADHEVDKCHCLIMIAFGDYDIQ